MKELARGRTRLLFGQGRLGAFDGTCRKAKHPLLLSADCNVGGADRVMVHHPLLRWAKGETEDL